MTVDMEEIKVLITLQRHTIYVKKFLNIVISKLYKASIEHDVSKYSEDEFAGFVQIQKLAREFAFGSPEYNAGLKIDAIKLHYAKNSHHPEHHKNGVKDMGLIDLVEMVCDWKAASETYGQTSFEKSLEIQKERYDLDDSDMRIIQLISECLE